MLYMHAYTAPFLSVLPAMEFSLAMYGAVPLFILLYCYFTWSKSQHPKYKLPPQASGARPILGHLHLISGCGSSAQPQHFTLGVLADQHGPIFTIRLGMRRVVVVSSWKIAKELFSTCDIAISSRAHRRATKHLTSDFAMFVFSPYGAYWRNMRKLVTLELLSSSRVEKLGHVCTEEIAQSVQDLYGLWLEKKDESGRMLVDMKWWLAGLNLNLILRIVAGKRLFSGGDDEEEMRRFRKVILDFFELVSLFVPADALPWLSWLDLGGYEKRMKQTAKNFDRIMGAWLEEHRQRGDSGGDKAEDFIDMMISALRGLEFDGQYNADTIIKSTCQAMILAGSETSSVILTWILSLLLNNRHVLTKAQEELDKHVGKERWVEKSDLCNLVYLQAIVKEAFRLYLPVPSIFREFNEDCNVGNYRIPKGTWLLINTWKLQRDPEVWTDNYLEFKPERFLTTQRNMEIKSQDFKLIPFGAGRRICPRIILSMYTLNLVLARLLQGFEIETIRNEAVDMTESVGFTNLKATPLEVLITPRQHPNLY